MTDSPPPKDENPPPSPSPLEGEGEGGGDKVFPYVIPIWMLSTDSLVIGSHQEFNIIDDGEL
jgi:hypothetical protein